MRSAVRLVEDVGLDGYESSSNQHRVKLTPLRQTRCEVPSRQVECLTWCQIDYEFPQTPAEAEALVHLLHELRAGLEHLASSKGRKAGQYQLTVAVPCDTENMQKVRVREMDQVGRKIWETRD